MKTLEQVRAHVSETYYDCSEKICGFLVGVELKDPKRILGFKKGGDYMYNFDDFLEWFDEEEEDVCGFCIGMINFGEELKYGTIFEDKKEGKCCCDNCKCEEKTPEFNVGELVNMEKEFEELNKEFDALYMLPEYVKQETVAKAIKYLNERIEGLKIKLKNNRGKKG